jgi:hypothetical protein
VIASKENAGVVLRTALSLKTMVSELKDGKIFQQRNDADDDHNHGRNLLRPAVEGQEIDEIQHENDDNEGDECANKSIQSPFKRNWPKPTVSSPIPITYLAR